jgi:hypothetical protein
MYQFGFHTLAQAKVSHLINSLHALNKCTTMFSPLEFSVFTCAVALSLFGFTHAEKRRGKFMIDRFSFIPSGAMLCTPDAS